MEALKVRKSGGKGARPFPIRRFKLKFHLIFFQLVSLNPELSIHTPKILFMKKRWLLIGLLGVGSHPAVCQTTVPYFAEYPALSPDGRVLVFSYDGDLWKSGSQGGEATRITAMRGEETRPRVSPDGQWIAFSGNQYGNDDVYLMPLAGGTVKRLTFHEGGDEVESWSWDSRFIYFTSNRYNAMSTYKVSIRGGTPVRVFSDNYFDYTHNAVEDPITGELFFDDTWESAFFANRIGYRGPFNPDIQSYNPQTGKYTRYTDWEGKDMWPTIDRKGTRYFVSDQDNGKYNLYRLDRGKPLVLTRFPTSVWHPCVDATGDRIVFEKDYRIWEYDVASGTSQPIPLEVDLNNTLPMLQDYTVQGNITGFDVSRDGKKLAFISRGRLFVSDVKGKFVREIMTRPAERVLEVHWLPDSRSVIYGQTWEGFENWFTCRVIGDPQDRQITFDSSNNRMMELNARGTEALYLRGRDELRIMDLPGMKTSTLVRDEIWGYENDQPHFSPDGKWALYTAKRNFESDIFLCRISSHQVYNLTNTAVSEVDPCFSPDGKNLYFISDRTGPDYPYGMQHARIYQMPLERVADPFASDQYDSLFLSRSPSPDTGSRKSGPRTTPDSTATSPNLDFTRLMDRIRQIGPAFGEQTDVYVTSKGDRKIILFISNHGEGKPAIWKLVTEPFEKDKTDKIAGGETYGLDIHRAGEDYYTLLDGGIAKLNLDGNSLEKLTIDFHFQRNLQEEFSQMFHETWANLEENYYNPLFNGVDWKGLSAKYAAFLPQLLSRTDLRKLINDMLGELNTSHYGFYSNGKEEATYYQTRTASPGILFDQDHPYRVDRVIPEGCSDYPSIQLDRGDELVEVDGIPVDTAVSREFYFSGASLPPEMTLAFRRGARIFQIKIHPESFRQTANLLYRDWERLNADRVTVRGKGDIAYIHMRDMSGTSLEEFEQEMVSDSVNSRKALILDLRYNTGGNVHDEVLRFLSRRPYLQWQYREGHMSPQPDFAPAGKPIVLLVNEQTLSDGEMTAAGFQALKLGVILGARTYHWIIFTSGKSLVDGSSYRLPSWGCYTLDGKNLEKTGVTPDVEVPMGFMDRMKGSDPQLDAAVDLIETRLK